MELKCTNMEYHSLVSLMHMWVMGILKDTESGIKTWIQSICHWWGAFEDSGRLELQGFNVTVIQISCQWLLPNHVFHSHSVLFYFTFPVFWDITQCSLLKVNQLFWGTCHLHRWSFCDEILMTDCAWFAWDFLLS
jgi:hypothetical protein